MLRCVVIGTGAYLPEKIMTNHDFPSSLETNHEWIVERTGIIQRHIAAEGENTSDLATHAGLEALKNSGISPETIDLVILATTTPDDTMPSTASKVQHRLGITNGAAFDVNAACSGFVYAMSIANSFIVSGQAKRILVIGAETYSRILDWNDRGTCILFGDGAAALVLEAQESSGTNDDRGVLFSCIHSDGQYTELLKTTGGISSTMSAGVLTMVGREIFRHAAAKMPASVEEGLQKLSLPKEAIDWLVPHQANMRILTSVARKLNISEDKVIATAPMHANTSAASIPLALHQASQDGRIRAGNLIACPALGAGLTWGCTIIRW
ncbi:MAG: beta-ketoacyl-ACP synthase III [Rickettsiales bacterium]|jgi:3-oxoacyl-[acyl-carrier-protein] synthase-3